MKFEQEDIDYLLSPQAIRDRTAILFDKIEKGEGHFKLNLDKLEPTAKFVLEVIREKYPTLDIPFHSRWGHFQVGGIDRIRVFNDVAMSKDKLDHCRSKIDLVVTSVLLDAGAGKDWKYHESESGKEYVRSEGLAIASYYMFMSGAFSNDRQDIFRADAGKLSHMTTEMIEEAFQVSEKNPLVGCSGRAGLLSKLGDTLKMKSGYFKNGRPGNIADYILSSYGNKIKAKDLLKIVLLGFGDIWPGRISLGSTNLGDVWAHPLVGDMETTKCLVPIHKLSQWLTYSLIEPLLEAGFNITGIEELTGLAEYRNGGLFLDCGVIELKDKKLLKEVHKPGSELIVEWRALTLQLLDRVAAMIREDLHKTESEFPLGKVLEGGTWWAGRKKANELREGGVSPLMIDSDGTVF